MTRQKKLELRLAGALDQLKQSNRAGDDCVKALRDLLAACEKVNADIPKPVTTAAKIVIERMTPRDEYLGKAH